MPYYARNAAKMAADTVLIAGSGDAASAMAASIKVDLLGEILQQFFQARGEKFNGSDIGMNDEKQAILYVREKKRTKTSRKTVLSGSKMSLHIAATAGGATIGSVVPGAGTALGAVGGYVGGASLAVGVTGLDRLKRTGKGIYKWARNSRGKHREQAAATLLHRRTRMHNRADGSNAADEALCVILGEEYETVVRSGDVARLAARLKSN